MRRVGKKTIARASHRRQICFSPESDDGSSTLSLSIDGDRISELPRHRSTYRLSRALIRRSGNPPPSPARRNAYARRGAYSRAHNRRLDRPFGDAIPTPGWIAEPRPVPDTSPIVFLNGPTASLPGAHAYARFCVTVYRVAIRRSHLSQSPGRITRLRASSPRYIPRRTLCALANNGEIGISRGFACN